jgi:hypothetical protein
MQTSKWIVHVEKLKVYTEFLQVTNAFSLENMQFIGEYLNVEIKSN